MIGSPSSIDKPECLAIFLTTNPILTLKHTHVNFRLTLDVCTCMYACTLGVNLTLSTLMSDFSCRADGFFVFYIGLIGIWFLIGTADVIWKVLKHVYLQ